jgi:hypothetical protein
MMLHCPLAGGIAGKEEIMVKKAAHRATKGQDRSSTAGPEAQKKKRPGGQRKPLKTLDPAKRIQGNPSIFL